MASKTVSPDLVPRALFSLKTNVRNNAHYITDFQILYPAGSVLILHNYYEKRQRFIRLFEKSRFIEMITVSFSRKLAAIIENGEKGQILVFDMQTLKRKRTLNMPPDSISNRFETIAFTQDDRYIVAITGDPDWNLVTYKWEKGKVISSTKATIPSYSANFIFCCCSPTDTNGVCVYGPGLFRMLTNTDSVWRQYGFSKADQINVTSATYISGDRVLCGTGDGKLFFIENGDLKGVYNALTATSINVKEKEDTNTMASSSVLITKTVSENIEDEDIAVRALISFNKGFAYSCRFGYVHMFEKENPNKFRKRNVFKVTYPDLGGMLGTAEYDKVAHLSINVSQDQLLATTKRAQIYSVRLWGPDLSVAPEIPFKHLGEPLHQGPVSCLAMCIWKSIFATAGLLDRTVRIWNYETETVQLVKQFREKILSIDLHPTGHFMAIGFAEKIDFDMILMNDIQNFRSLPIKNCDKCIFSFLGHLGAFVVQESIEIWRMTFLNHVLTFKGHTGKINNIRFSGDDKRLVSCGEDGMIIMFDTNSGDVLQEYQTSGVSYFDIVITHDSKFIYAVGNDNFLREFTDSFVSRVISFNGMTLDRIALSRSNHRMFIIGDATSVISVKMPLSDPPDFSHFHYHSRKINEVKITFDDQSLITVGQGGNVLIWNIMHSEGKAVTMEKNFLFSNNILINKNELEKKISTIKDLTQKLYEMEMLQAREIRDTESGYNEKIKEIHGSFNQAIAELKEKVEQTEVEQRTQLINIKKEIEELKKKQQREKKDMIKNYMDKLSMEYEKFRSLDALKEQLVNDYENRVAELERSKEEETNEIITIYEEKLEEVNNLLKESYTENAENAIKHEIETRHLEDDADRELVETRAKYEEILKGERDLHGSLKDKVVTLKKNHAEAQKERDEFRTKCELLKVEQKKYLSNTQALEKEIADLKTEIIERDLALEKKDERIYLLKQKVLELDKFKFVLDYKIKELKKEIDPKDREIREKKEQIIDMEVELENLKKINSSLELQLGELREKICGTEREVSGYEKTHQSGVNTLRQIKIDIYTLYQDLNDFKKLKDGMKILYHKYYKDDIGRREHFGESDAQRELMLQREFLERTIAALKSTLRKSKINENDHTKVIQDNVVLLEELNQIRKDLKSAATSVKNLEKLLGVSEKKTVVPREAFNKLQEALRKKDAIKQVYQGIINDADEETQELSAKIKKMQDKLCLLLQTHTTRRQ